KRQQYAMESKRILENWLLVNFSHPYPTQEEYVILSQQTGLSKKQISMWFKNYRRRKLI
ncbi:hypothetical protein ROZALSC1DRAFT_2488, partial [Rozella allomycis CSF55]